VNNPLILSCLAGLFFGFWPVIARFSNLRSSWVALLIPLGTVILVSFSALPKMLATETPAYRAIALGLLAGAFNGVGMLAYGKILGNSDWDVSRYVPVTAVFSIAAAAIGAFIIFREHVTIQKTLGLLFAAAAVWLLS
jgi:hypothetical protein